MNLNHREAFIKTRKYFGIKGNKLHEITGVSANHISEYTRGKRDVSTKILDQLIEGMEQLAPGAKRYYCNYLFGQKLVLPEDIVADMNADELSLLMLAIASRIGSGNVKISNSPLLVS